MKTCALFMCFSGFARAYQDFSSTNPFLEYAFTMMYLDIGTQSCSKIIEKDKDALIASLGQIFSVIDSVNLNGFNSYDIIKSVDDVYLYCQKNPNAIFATALADTLKADLKFQGQFG